MIDDKDYLTPKDVANHFGVTPGTVYHWIQKEWLSAEKVIPQKQNAKRAVGRYRIDVDVFARFDSAIPGYTQELRRFLPRVLRGSVK